MLNNYQYFIALAEEQNLSRAAERLFISHQYLSQYIKNLEEEYGTAFFTRRPFTLTESGQVMLEALRKVERIELDLNQSLKERQDGSSGELKIGTTEGRLRLLMPDLMQEFCKEYPRVNLRMSSSRTRELLDLLLNNKLDFLVIGDFPSPNPALLHQVIMKEHLYLVISDNLLKECFPNDYPECKKSFSKGADLSRFQHVPFVMNYPGSPSRTILDNHLLKLNSSLRCINELTSMDLHHLMSARDYAASFALTMYLPEIQKMNLSGENHSPLNVFPIAGLTGTNTITITYRKDKLFPEYAFAAMKTLKLLCRHYSSYEM